MKKSIITTRRADITGESAACRFAREQLNTLMVSCQREPKAVRMAIKAALDEFVEYDQRLSADAEIAPSRPGVDYLEHVQELAVQCAEDALDFHGQKHTVTQVTKARALNLIRNALRLPPPPLEELRARKVPADKAKRIAELAEDDRVTVAWHEAGHVIVLLSYGYHADARICDSGVRRMDIRPFEGRTTCVDLPEMSAFEHSVFGWAGKIAEKLLEEPEAEVGDLWSACDSGDTSDLAQTDQCHVYAHPQTWRAFKTAARILSKHHQHLKAIAEALQKTHRWSGTLKSEKLVASICGPTSDTK